MIFSLRKIVSHVLGLGLAACGAGSVESDKDGALPDDRTGAAELDSEEKLQSRAGREVRLVGVYRPFLLEVKLGQLPMDPGHVVLWVGRRPVRLGLIPRPLEERERFNDETVEVRGRLLVPEVLPADPESPVLILPTIDPFGPVELYDPTRPLVL